MAFAPGKVLLLGEHAVVYGEPALAAATSVGVTANACAGAPRLRAPAWGLDVRPGDGTRVGAAFAALLAALPASWAADVTVHAEIPAGAGMGSSAAMAVATARALAAHADESALLDDARLFDAAMASEGVFHGNPSGLDHAVAMHGGVIRFTRDLARPGQPSIARVACPTALHLVIAQMAPGADTGAMVAGVAERRATDPSVAAAIAEIGARTATALDAVAAGDLDALGAAMNANHTLLQRIGVSTPALDAGVDVARDAGALGAKLTGAGGGGCIVALATAANRASIADALSAPGRFVLATEVAPSA